MSIYYDKNKQMKLVFYENYSPNFSTQRRNVKNIKFIIIHYTGMNSENRAINRLCSVNSKVSCHYFIKKNGQIILMVPEKYIAWHSGISKWKNYNLLNKYSIGIEIQNPGHFNKYTKFNSKQIRALIRLCSVLRKKYNISKKNILGHSDVSYERKKDPGEKFPWQNLAKKNISIWHDIDPKSLVLLRKSPTSNYEKKMFYKNLSKFGYHLKRNIKSQKLLTFAFQRRFRKKLVNGIIDKECLNISKKLCKL